MATAVLPTEDLTSLIASVSDIDAAVKRNAANRKRLLQLKRVAEFVHNPSSEDDGDDAAE